MTTHFEELMEDRYGWEKVKAFNAAWLNQLEQKRTDWLDREARMKLGRALVWHPTLTIKTSGTGATVGLTKNQVTSTHIYGAPAKPSMNTCRAFNEGMCLKAQDHPQWQHMCAFCLKTTNRAYPHSQKKIPVPTKKHLRAVVTSSPSPEHGIHAISQMHE